MSCRVHIMIYVEWISKRRVSASHGKGYGTNDAAAEEHDMPPTRAPQSRRVVEHGGGKHMEYMSL